MSSTKEQNAEWRKRRSAIKCIVRDCPRGSTAARGYCPAHYRRVMDGLPVNTVPPPRMKNVGPCSVEGCSDPAHSRGWCRRHYSRFFRNGIPGPAEMLRQAPGEGSCGESTKGYHVISVDGRRKSAHRVAMEALLGRELLPRETVHHVDGQRANNRTAGPLVNFRSGNLELWFKPQPAGQRVSDLIAYVAEHHAEAVLAALEGAPHAHVER